MEKSTARVDDEAEPRGRARGPASLGGRVKVPHDSRRADARKSAGLPRRDSCGYLNDLEMYELTGGVQWHVCELYGYLDRYIAVLPTRPTHTPVGILRATTRTTTRAGSAEPSESAPGRGRRATAARSGRDARSRKARARGGGGSHPRVGHGAMDGDDFEVVSFGAAS